MLRPYRSCVRRAAYCACGCAHECELAREPAHDEDHAPPSLPDIITYRSTTSHTGVHVSTCGRGKNQRRININFSTRHVDSGQTPELCTNVSICDVEKCIDLHHWRAVHILSAVREFPDEPSPVHVGALAMARSNGGKAKAFFRANPSGAFDQYLQDIQKLPLIKD